MQKGLEVVSNLLQMARQMGQMVKFLLYTVLAVHTLLVHHYRPAESLPAEATLMPIRCHKFAFITENSFLKVKG